MNCPQYDFMLVTGHGTGGAFFDYLRLFDGLSLSINTGLPDAIEHPDRYNGICFRDLLIRHFYYYNTVKIISIQEKVHLFVLTRDPILVLVTHLNTSLFSISLAFMGLLPLSSRKGGIQSRYLLEVSNRHEFFRRLLLPSETYFNHTMLDHRLLPFFKNKITEVHFVDTHDVLPENIYSTLDGFKQKIFNSETDYTRVDVNISLYSVYTGWMFRSVPAFQYASDGLNFSLRPWPLQLNWLQQTPNNTYISYDQAEVEWTCGKFDGQIAFNLVPTKDMMPPMISELMPKIREVCEADNKKLLREYCRKTSFRMNLVYKFYHTINTSKEEVLEFLRNDHEYSEILKKKIYAQAAAFHELGYDVNKHWTATTEFFEGGNILPEEHKNDHLYAVIDELKVELLRLGELANKLMQEKADLENRIACFMSEESEQEMQNFELKQKHQVSSLSKKQKIAFRLITPIVKKFASDTQFNRFRESPVLFFKSLKKRRYRILGEILFPIR